MRRMIAPLALLLALLTGAWFGQAYVLFVPLEPFGAANVSTAHAAEATVWRFYDAVDILLRTGDDSALIEAVAPDFLDHADRPGLPSTRDGLVNYIASLREIHPDLSLTPLDFAAQGDRIVVQIELAGGDGGSVLGMPLAGTRPWPGVDIVRVLDGRIAERWGDRSGHSLVTPILSEMLTVPTGPMLIPSLNRMTYTPAANDRAAGRHGPAVILVETGTIEIQMEDSGNGAVPRPYPVEEPISPVRATPETQVPTTLAPGDVLVVPSDVTFTTNNPTAAIAVVLILLLETPTETPVNHTISRTPLLDGITIQTLAGISSAVIGPGPHTLSIGHVALGPGAQLASHNTTGVELLVVDVGTMTATVTGGTYQSWLRYPNGYLIAARPVEQVSATSALTVPPGTTAAYRNDGPALLALLLVTIEPAVGATMSDPSQK